tara:strand:+ start:98 stop:808 length:711 start_codon:yes stop_codon:yes gene_type:complete
MSDSTAKLQNNRVDNAVSVAKGILGAIPFAGGAFAELIGTVVPNQRLDRITSFLIELDKRLEKFEIEMLKRNELSLDLFEDGMYQAVRVLSEARNRYLANFIKHSIDVDSNSYSIKKRLLSILQDLTDRDIEILKSISEDRYQATARKYGTRSLAMGEVKALSDDEKYEYDHERASFGLHLSTLNRLSLVNIQNKQVDPKKRRSHLDFNTGLPEIEDCSITRIGQLLLMNIQTNDC